ncbi:hypothetical protein NDU88_007009 [Pleurodeles waltl]|uniref:Uncharacterized protein n=1 Tax=Pleurodeles waltl TaxID=8319 RepID=A0AAV7TYH4_PLEWA|nr:hypothetical protein NDU88_007009 [Pleurodeles waltl]
MREGWTPVKNQDRRHWLNQATNLNVKAERCLNEEAEDVQTPPTEEQAVQSLKGHPIPAAPLPASVWTSIGAERERPRPWMRRRPTLEKEQ